MFGGYYLKVQTLSPYKMHPTSGTGQSPLLQKGNLWGMDLDCNFCRDNRSHRMVHQGYQRLVEMSKKMLSEGSARRTSVFVQVHTSPIPFEFNLYQEFCTSDTVIVFDLLQTPFRCDLMISIVVPCCQSNHMINLWYVEVLWSVMGSGDRQDESFGTGGSESWNYQKTRQ